MARTCDGHPCRRAPFLAPWPHLGRLMPYLLLTGSTGLLGGQLLRDALVARRPVAAVVRGRGRQTGRDRLEAMIQHWETQLGKNLPRPVVIDGDLHEPGLGVSAVERRWIAEHCDAVLHSAARVSFESDDEAGEPLRSNVGGTQHLLQLCEASGVRRLYHVSTAYVAGRRTGAIREDDPVGAEGFCNEYERTKAVAEQLVRSAKHLQSATILRPSIIVGDSLTGFASAFHGIYTPLRLGYLHLLGKLREGWQLDLQLVESVVNGQFIDQLGLTGHERKNLVPVDWVSRSVMSVVADPNAAGHTYHLTADEPTSIGALAVAMIDAALTSLESAATVKPGIPSTLLQAEGFREHMQVYREYLGDDPQFVAAAIRSVRGGTACPTLDHDGLVRLWAWAIEADFTWRPPVAALPKVDLAAALAGLPGGGDGSNWSCRLDLTGPGGGSWRVAVGTDALVAAEPAAPGDLPRIALSAETLSEIAAHRLQLETAVDSGRVTAIGDGSRQILFDVFPRLIALLAAAQAPAPIAPANRPA